MFHLLCKLLTLFSVFCCFLDWEDGEENWIFWMVPCVYIVFFHPTTENIDAIWIEMIVWTFN